MRASRLLALAALLGVSSWTGTAASAPVDVGTLPATLALKTLPSPPGGKLAERLPGVTLRKVGQNDQERLELATSGSTCVSRIPDDGSGGEEAVPYFERSTSIHGDSVLDVLTLAERDGGATLERQRVRIFKGTVGFEVMSRQSVALAKVATSTRLDVVVWAFRERNNVVLLTRSVADVDSTYPRFDAKEGAFTQHSMSSCGFGIVSIAEQAAERGAVASLEGAAKERDGKKVVRFAASASLSKVTRDPRPVLSAKIRVLDGP